MNDRVGVLCMLPQSGVGADTVRAERAATAGEREDKHCNGVWAAAGDGQQRRMSKQAVTGRCVGGCALHGLGAL